MLDLSAALDTIVHRILLNRLKYLFVITGKALHWITSYLSNPYQTISIDGILSQPVYMKYSVPQVCSFDPNTIQVRTICFVGEQKFIIFTSQMNEKYIKSITVTIGDENIKPSICVRNLGFTLDFNMAMEII